MREERGGRSRCRGTLWVSRKRAGPEEEAAPAAPAPEAPPVVKVPCVWRSRVSGVAARNEHQERCTARLVQYTLPYPHIHDDDHSANS